MKPCTARFFSRELFAACNHVKLGAAVRKGWCDVRELSSGASVRVVDTPRARKWLRRLFTDAAAAQVLDQSMIRQAEAHLIQQAESLFQRTCNLLTIRAQVSLDLVKFANLP